MLGIVDHLISRSDLYDLAVVHHCNPVAHVMNDRHVMTDKEITKAEFILQIVEKIQDLGLDRDIERRGRFVADDESRLDGQRPGDSNALPLTAAELVRVSICSLLPETAALQELFDSVLKFVTFGETVHHQRLSNQSADPHSRIQRPAGILEDDLHLSTKGSKVYRGLLEDRLSIENHLAAGRRNQSQDGSTDGGLATPGFTHEPQRFAGGEIKTHTVDGANVIHGSLKNSPFHREVGIEISNREQGTLGRTGLGVGRHGHSSDASD